MSMNGILPIKEGGIATVFNVLEYNQFKHHGDHKDNELFITYRDETGKKNVHRITEPPMEIFFVKPEYRKTFLTPREYYPIDNVYPVKVPARLVLRRIYDEMKVIPDPVGQKLIQVYNNGVTTGNSRVKKEIFKWPYALFGDMSVEDYYWVQLGVHYDLSHGGVIDKVFADIENDIYGLNSSEQAMNMDPVNAVTLIFNFDQKSQWSKLGIQVFTFLLEDYKRYPQQEKFVSKLNDFYAECHKCFDIQTVIKKGKKKEVHTKAEYHIVMCKTENDLLKNVFDTINRYKPDLCEFWNMPYDMPKMKARMEYLGMDPVEIMSDKDFFPRDCQYVDFHMDNRPIDIAERNSYIRMTSTTQYIDQMQNYAGIRKGRKAYGSNKLDNIANIELGMGKWDFPKGIDVTNAAILDYWNFVLYNIRDVWCQYLIDFVTNDTMSLVYDMNQHNCPLHHLVKQTKYQKQIYYAGYLRRGFVPGHNINVNYTEYANEEEAEKVEEARKRKALRMALDKLNLDEDDIDMTLLEGIDSVDDLITSIGEDSVSSNSGEEEDETSEAAKAEAANAYDENLAIFEDSPNRKLPLPGGLVGNPDNNFANGAELIDGIPSKHVFDEVMDEDYASEYPWAKFTRSLSRSTQIGRLIIPHKVSKYQNLLPLGQVKRKEDTKYYIPGAEFTGDYLSQDYLSLGSAWFNLPLSDECGDIIDQMLDGVSLDEALKKVEEKDGQDSK